MKNRKIRRGDIINHTHTVGSIELSSTELNVPNYASDQDENITTYK